MAFFEYLCHLFVCMFFSGIFFLSVLKLVDTFFLIGKFNSLLLKIEQHKAIIKMLKPHLTPEVVHPNIKKTLLKQLGQDNFSIVVDRTPHFPCKEVYLASTDILHSYVLASDINNYVLGSKIQIFFFYSSLWTI